MGYLIGNDAFSFYTFNNLDAVHEAIRQIDMIDTAFFTPVVISHILPSDTSLVVQNPAQRMTPHMSKFLHEIAEPMSISDSIAEASGLPHVNSTAGVAGSTSNVAGLKKIIMADGPAGLRIAKDYYITENGPQSTTGSFPPTLIEYFPDEVKVYFTPQIPEGVEIYQQYTTALPIATALAQSWNRKFAEVCGDIVGTEMEMFEVNLWLAPALNIHRSILCGRNFEYYSEDPLISGAFAASITKGVQSHNKTYVTLKHYAANNQETNRYLSSSNVSERAFREIYLRGFEMAVTNQIQELL